MIALRIGFLMFDPDILEALGFKVERAGPLDAAACATEAVPGLERAVRAGIDLGLGAFAFSRRAPTCEPRQDGCAPTSPERHDMPQSTPAVHMQSGEEIPQEIFEKTYLSNKLTVPSAPWQRELGTLRRNTVYMAPRGHGKTTHILFVQPLRVALCQKEPRFTLIIGQTLEKAIKYLDAIKRQLETNRNIRRDFGDQVNSRWWKADIIELRNGHVIQAAGWDQCARGIQFDLRRPDIIKADDPESLQSVMSETQRQKAEDIFLGEIVPALSAGGYAELVGTVINEDCLVARIARNKMWSKRKYAAIIQEATRQDLWEEFKSIWMSTEGRAEDKERAARAFYEAHKAEMDEGAEVLWPQMWDYYRLYCRRLEIGTLMFNAEYQQEPVDDQTAIFQRTWFKRVSAGQIAHLQMRKIIAVDPALGRRPGADPSAYVVIGFPVNETGAYVLEYSQRLRTVSALCEDLYRAEERHGRPEIYIEEVGFQAVLKDILDQMEKRKGRTLSIRGIGTEGVAKNIRIMRLPARVETGWLQWVSDGPGVEEAITKIQRWRPGVDDDHAPDVIEMCLRAYEKSTAEPIYVFDHV